MKPIHGYQICPVCGSGDIEHVGKGIPGGTFCKECGYRGFFIEVDTLEEVKEMQESLKSHKGENVAPATGSSVEKNILWWYNLIALLILIAIGIAYLIIKYLL